MIPREGMARRIGEGIPFAGFIQQGDIRRAAHYQATPGRNSCRRPRSQGNCLKNGILRLRKELKLPETLAQAGIAPGQVWHHSRQIVEAVLDDPCCKTNPLTVEGFMVRRILEEVTGRA